MSVIAGEPASGVGVCARCGRSITHPGPDGECVRCLVSFGFLGEEDEVQRGSEGTNVRLGPLRYAHFEVQVNADGYPKILGSGAMAVTYGARDTILNSVVALKVIDRKVAQNPGARSRFLREARLAAQIHHPNVARVSHYGEQDGECFYVMELVHGETLEERVRKNGPMSLALALEVTEQTARALAAAEACGVVHRDLKPSNIMLESDASGSLLVKVIDYGVAKVLAPQTLTVDQTQTGFIGTPAFASPEQFGQQTGETRVDTRSDIYSLGATLWYLLTGRVPFLAGSMEAIRTKQEKALPVEELRTLHIPTQVVSLLKSMLAPDPKARPQSARELLSQLHQVCARFNPEARARRRRLWITRALLTTGVAAAALVIWFRQDRQTIFDGGRSIAVLPFENLSSNADDAYLAIGIQEEILTKLASVADLKVISRNSTERYKSKPADLKTVGKQLGVANVLEGSVQRAADKVRVNVQLIDTRNDTHVWANTYDRDIKDVFAVESEISQTIASALKAKLSPDETNRLTSAPTQDPEAYDLFLRGEYAMHEANTMLKAEPFNRASAFYEQAVARDPNFALAASRLVVSRIRRHFFISKLSAAELEAVKRLADETVASAPDLPEAHTARALYYYLGYRQYDEALKELQRALELQPNHIIALEVSAYMHRRQGRWQLGISEMEKCETRDPRNSELVANIAGAYCNLRMWKEARRDGLRALALDPNSTLGLQTAIFASLNLTGDIEAAKRTLADYPQPGRVADFSVVASSRTAVYLKVIERDFAGALKLYESEIDDPAENRSRLATRAAIHVLAGNTAAAHEEIARARDLLEARLREQPDDAPAHLQLAWVNLALQRNAEAVRLARHATELVPVEKDAILGPTYLAALAEIQARAAESDEAVKTLQRLLAMPIGYYISIQQLKIDPVWDPIRNDPGFQQLLVGKESVGANL